MGDNRAVGTLAHSGGSWILWMIAGATRDRSRDRADSDAYAATVKLVLQAVTAQASNLTAGAHCLYPPPPAAAQFPFICRLPICVRMLRWFVIQKQTDGARIAPSPVSEGGDQPGVGGQRGMASVL